MIEVRRFVQAFEQTVGQNIAVRQAQLGKGQCQDFTEYKKITGEIRGMEAASGLARDMLRQIEMAEDEPPAPTGGKK